MSRVFLLTGASGHVGRAVWPVLARCGHLTAIGRRPLAASTETAIVHDLSQPLPPWPDLAGATVVHCAAEIRASDWITHWKGNIEATRHVLDWAVRHGSRRVVVFSTGSVYGFQPDRRMVETDPLAPDGPYAHSKRIVEAIADAYAQQFGLAVVTFRLYFPYGGEPAWGLFGRIEHSVANGEALTINRGGAPRLTPVHVDDVSAAVLMSVSDTFHPGVYNLCGDEDISVLEAVERTQARLGRTTRLAPSDLEPGDMMGSNERLRGAGWTPRHSIRQDLGPLPNPR